MNTRIPLRRLVLAGILTATAAGAAPTLASAASTCSLDENTHNVTVNDGSGSASLRIVRFNQFIEVADGPSSPHAWDGPTSFAAATHTDRVVVIGNAVSTTDGYLVDESQGALAPGVKVEADGNSEIE